MSSITSKIIKISGKVQHVGFRYYCQKKANELIINGFVVNKHDGSVYIEAEGDSDQLDHFIIWCNSGPRWARVDKIQISDQPLMNFTNFSIR